MTIVNKEYLVIERKERAVEYGDIKIVADKNEILLTIQKVTETRIRKDNKSVFANSPSREIKKWFELRKI